MIIDTPYFVELAKLLCSVEKRTDNDFFENELMKKTDYYFTKLYYKKANKMYQSIYSIGWYIRKNHSINENLSTELTSDSFHTLAPKKYLEGEIINACSLIHEHDWINTTFISTISTSSIFDDSLIEDDVRDESNLLRINFPSTGNVLLPYCRYQHWRLVIINMDLKYLSLIDPMVKDAQSTRLKGESLRVLQRFLNFIYVCKEKRKLKMR